MPFVDLAAQFAEVADEVLPGVEEVLRTAGYVGGPHVATFEAAYAQFVGVSHCVGVGNGTDAIELALRAVGVRAGSEVVVPANTFIATAEAVSRIGATPVLVDVDDDYLLIDPEACAAAIGPRTAAVVPVHLFGQVAPVEEVLMRTRDAGIPVVEDAAQSQGARRHGRAAGTLGAAAATSFYPGKNLGAAGDAGAVFTDDSRVARDVRVLAQHGSEQKYDHEVVGMNSRLDAIQSVVLSAKLARLETWNAARRAAAARYAELLADLPVRVPTTREGNDDAWHLYVVRVEGRDRVLADLAGAGIGTGVHYPTPLHLTQAYAGLGLRRGAFPVAEAASAQILSLPMHPHLTEDQQVRVVDALRRALGA
nr:DegT/DnrJ/EryC1/StrS family aminotransferase [Luteimicrobium subarcticum]